MEVDDPRLETVIRLERFALAARYMAYFMLVPFVLLRQEPVNLRNLAIITIALIVHNFFVHMVLWFRRYRLFRTGINFTIHLGMTSLIVAFTGAEQSEMYVLYLFMLLGFSAYSRTYSMIVLVAVLLTFTYASIIFVQDFFVGMRVTYATIGLKLGSILVCGWFVATLSGLLRRAEDSARMRAAALASSEATLRTILDSTANPILVYDENECITVANNRACEFLGMSREELLGRRFSTVLFDDGTLSELLRDIEEKGWHTGEQIFLHADGHERTVELHVRSFVRDRKKFFVVVAHDISEQKNLQEAAHLANAHLNRLNRELQQVNELKTGLLKSLSQRIRSPLTAIMGYVDMLLNEELGQLLPEQRRALQTCRRSTERVFGLVDEAFHARLVEMNSERPAPRETRTP